MGNCIGVKASAYFQASLWDAILLACHYTGAEAPAYFRLPLPGRNAVQEIMGLNADFRYFVLHIRSLPGRLFLRPVGTSGNRPALQRRYPVRIKNVPSRRDG